jgi:pyruvate,water dikinase
MIKIGIPVPPGFVVLSNAFDKFLEETNLKEKINYILSKINIEDIHFIENASSEIHKMILSNEIPEYIKQDIWKNYKELNSKYVAVRSSATVEDSKIAAWAGQLETYLNVTKENLFEFIKRCWASLFTSRDIFYRFEKKLDKQEISVAVVIQKMVDSEKSGIAFSVHPVTQDKNQIIIEAGF